MGLIVMGASYKTAPLEIRERMGIRAGSVPAALQELSSYQGVDGCMLLSTCNRIEVYVDARTDFLGIQALKQFFARRCGLDLGSDNSPANDEKYARALHLQHDYFYLHRGMDAVRHIFRVVCSLDSQLLGEAQILGQMRSAFENSEQQGCLGGTLSHLAKSALHLGKKVRTETAIGADSVSLSTTALQLIKQACPQFERETILLVGTGEMAGLLGRYLSGMHPGKLLVSSHNAKHAQSFAQQHQACDVPFARLHAHAAEARVVVSMTASDTAVLRASELEGARAQSGASDSPLLIIDLAVPRDVEPACADLLGVNLYNLESLTSIIDDGLAHRMSEVGRVERMIDEAYEDFFTWMQQRQVLPTIKDIRTKGQSAVDKECAKAEKALAALTGTPLSDEVRAILQAYGESVMNKILHGPTARLRKESGVADSYYYTGAARYLFGLDAFPVQDGKVRHICLGAEKCPAGGCAKGRKLDEYAQHVQPAQPAQPGQPKQPETLALQMQPADLLEA